MRRATTVDTLAGMSRSTFAVLLGAMLASGCNRAEKAQEQAQVLATAVASAYRAEPGTCPTLTGMRANGSLASSVATEDPWGTFFVATCKGSIVTVTSAGPDRVQGTPDDIHATAVTVAAIAPTPKAAARAPDPPAVTAAPVSAACAACERERIACLLGVQRGELVPGTDAFENPVEASRDACALGAMTCFSEAKCPRK